MMYSGYVYADAYVGSGSSGMYFPTRSEKLKNRRLRRIVSGKGKKKHNKKGFICVKLNRIK